MGAKCKWGWQAKAQWHSGQKATTQKATTHLGLLGVATSLPLEGEGVISLFSDTVSRVLCEPAQFSMSGGRQVYLTGAGDDLISQPAVPLRNPRMI